MDDNRVFVENPWEEENVGSRISDDVKAKVKSLANLVDTTVMLGKLAFHRNLFVITQCTRKPKKVFQQQDLSVLLKLQNHFRKNPRYCFPRQQPAHYNHRELFDLKKGMKNG